MKNVFLIILNWNGWKMTLDCLESLEEVKCNNFKIETVVVDNGSTDDSLNQLKVQSSLLRRDFEGQAKFKIAIKVLKNDKNLGFAEGNNVGIRYALEKGADFICLLNNDTRVDPDFVAQLVKTAESDNKIGIAGGKIYFEKGYEFHKDRYKEDERGKVIWYVGGLIDWKNVYSIHRGVNEVDSRQFDHGGETDFVSGCLMLVKKEVFQKAGLFDKRYFLYFEDADLSQRAKIAGFKLVFCPKSIVWHLNSGSSGSGSELHDYFITRNRLLFGMKFAPLRSKIALVKESLGLFFHGRKWQKIGVRDYYLRRFGKGSWGA